MKRAFIRLIPVDDLALAPGQLDQKQRDLLATEYWRLAGEYDVEPGNGRLLDKLPLNITRLGFIRQVFPRAPISCPGRQTHQGAATRESLRAPE